MDKKGLMQIEVVADFHNYLVMLPHFRIDWILLCNLLHQ